MSHKTQSPFYLTLQKFRKNFWGVLSLLVISFYILIALFAYILAPDSTSNANQMHLAIHSQPPGFKSSILKIPLKSSEDSSLLDWWTGSTSTVQEIAINDIIKEDELFYLIPYSDTVPELPKQQVTQSIQDTSLSLEEFKEMYVVDKTFLLGTDKYGRDLLSRMLIGSRISISIGLISVLISLIIGLSLGSIAGFYGGWVDNVIMWFINVTWSIPTLLMVIAISIVLEKGFFTVFIAVGLTMWVEVARVARGQVISLKENQYIVAARALGLKNGRIILKHILPNIMAPIIVISAANFAASILIESGLSFLGIGAQPPTPSWGSMIKDHYQYIILDKAYLAIIPGLAIMSLVMAFMLLGNALRDALDVKTAL